MRHKTCGTASTKTTNTTNTTNISSRYKFISCLSLYALGRDQDSGINLYWYAVRILLSGAHVNYIVCAMRYEYYLAVFMSL